jgi:hypothetical protein
MVLCCAWLCLYVYTQYLCHYAAAKLNFEDTVVSIAVTDNRDLFEYMAPALHASGSQTPAVVAFSKWDDSETNPAIRVAGSTDVRNGESMLV